MSSLAAVLLAELDDRALAELAQRLAPYLRAPAPAADDGWLDTKTAADYLGLSAHSLRRLVAERKVPHSQAQPGAKCWFRRSELDRWRERDGQSVR